jgi:nucleoside-diphosphate-sugar epimerase
MRQGTVFGYSPRMRFDLAINGMTYGAWKNRKLPLMRDGSQYRPMLHVQDSTDVMLLLLKADSGKINSEIFNVGGDENNCQIGPLGNSIAKVVGEKIGAPVEVEWYGDPDHRSYFVCFDKIRDTLGWTPEWDSARGAREVVDALESGRVEKTPRTITLEWYRELVKWHRIIRGVEKYEGILDIV